MKFESKNGGSKQAERSAATRAALLQAAETVFARDGFEAARIEDIALEAGRSRGAFYANFESKTELFLALREQLARKRARAVRGAIHDLPDPAARGAAIKEYLVEEILNERQLLLEIEFKLFALRRPEMQQALAAKHLESSCRITREELAPFVPGWDTEYKHSLRKTTAVEAMMEGLALNHLFYGSALNAEDVAALLPGLIDHIIDASNGDQESSAGVCAEASVAAG